MSVRSKLANIKRVFLEEGPFTDAPEAAQEGRYPSRSRQNSSRSSNWQDEAIAAANRQEEETQQTTASRDRAFITTSNEWALPQLAAECKRLGLNAPSNPTAKCQYGGLCDGDQQSSYIRYAWKDDGIAFEAMANCEYRTIIISVHTVFSEPNFPSRSKQIRTQEDLGQALKTVQQARAFGQYF